MPWVAIDRRLDHTVGILWRTVADREIGLADGMAAKCDRQGEMCAIRFGHHHDAGRIFVETMNDSGSFDAADAGKIPAVMEEGVDQGAGRVAGGRVNDEARRFVDDQQVVIFVQNWHQELIERVPLP